MDERRWRCGFACALSWTCRRDRSGRRWEPPRGSREVQNPPDPGRGPALTRLRRLFELIRHAVDDLHHRLRVDAHHVVHVAPKELWKALHLTTCSDDARVQVRRLSGIAVAPQTVRDHASVHRPYRAIVIR